MAKPKRIRADELWPGDVFWLKTDVAGQWGTFLVRVVSASHKRCVKLELQTLDDGAPTKAEFGNNELVQAFQKPVTRPQPNFSVD